MALSYKTISIYRLLSSPITDFQFITQMEGANECLVDEGDHIIDTVKPTTVGMPSHLRTDIFQRS